MIASLGQQVSLKAVCSPDSSMTLLVDTAFHGSSFSAGNARTLAQETSDEVLQKTMMEAHMRTEISRGDVDVGSSSFQRVPPEFKTMMWSIAGHFRSSLAAPLLPSAAIKPELRRQHGTQARQAHRPRGNLKRGICVSYDGGALLPHGFRRSLPSVSEPPASRSASSAAELHAFCCTLNACSEAHPL